MMSDKDKVYILKTVGVSIPGYDRKDLKVGMSVTLDSKVGDAFAKRGFLTKADAAAPKVEKVNKALQDENAKLLAENEALQEQLKALKK